MKLRLTPINILVASFLAYAIFLISSKQSAQTGINLLVFILVTVVMVIVDLFFGNL